MSITNLGTLQTSVESYLERTLSDSLFVEFAAEITSLLHVGMRDASDRFWVVPPARPRVLCTTATLSVSSAAASLPADWLEFERLWINTSTGKPLRYIPLQEWWNEWDVQETGEPTKYTIDDTTVRFAPTSDATVQATYYQTLGALASDSDTNVILTATPHVYRHGCLWKALDWEGNLERAAGELASFGASVRALNAQRGEAQTRGSLLVMRPGAVA